jgi:murein DD-endopeptidase MepM/ murein hydrolase activator NlpD
MALIFTHKPLETMKLVQGFGGDITGGALPIGDGKFGGYKELGLKGHNGFDLSTGASNGKKVFAVHKGRVEMFKDSGYGVNARLIITVNADMELECVYGHLQEVTKTGEVQGGEQFAISDNTGISTGPHLHFGVRLRVRGPNGSTQVINYDNGYFGYVDPHQFFPLSVFNLPVDDQYGNTWQTPGVLSEWEWMKTNAWFYKTFMRLMTKQERNAFRYGFWDVRTVIDPAMFPIWSQMTKMEAQKQGIVK